MLLGWLRVIAVVRRNDVKRAVALVGAYVDDLLVDAVLYHSKL